MYLFIFFHSCLYCFVFVKVLSFLFLLFCICTGSFILVFIVLYLYRFFHSCFYCFVFVYILPFLFILFCICLYFFILVCIHLFSFIFVFIHFSLFIFNPPSVFCSELKYNKIQYKHEYYYSGINPVEFRGHSKTSHY